LTNIIIVFPKIRDAQNICNFLVSKGIPVAAVSTSGSQALQYMDRLEEGIVLCGYRLTDMLYSQLQEYLPLRFEMLLVASQHIIQNCEEQDIISLVMPIRGSDLIDTLSMMSQAIERSYKKQGSLENERFYEEKSVIAKAKELLMERNNMTESEAYRYIQKYSMDTGTDIAKTAQIVLSFMQ
jgi:two-component system, response regulator PdtaR